MTDVAAAELAVARQRVKQAQDACRKATQRLAAASNGTDVYGQRTCTTRQDAEAVARLVSLALAEHDRVEVVLLISP